MTQYTMNDLLDVMKKLRDPEKGCVWDKQQTYKSIIPYTLEEVYEVVEAIETDRIDLLPGELGDLLFQIVFYAQIGSEQEKFEFNDVVNQITEKMIRRHPHVFSDTKIDNVEDQSKLWDEIKSAEKAQQPIENNLVGTLDGVNYHQPAISRSIGLQKKAAKTGFDWRDIDGPIEKIKEELQEVIEAVESMNQDHILDEVGDLFFAVSNLARHLNVDPEMAVASTNRKFQQRFDKMEALALAQGKDFAKLSLDEKEQYWVKVKQQ